MLKYEPREAFIPFHNRKQRWAALNTHRRAGKTVAVVNDIVFGALECQKYRPQLAYVGPTYSQAKRVAWQYLKDFAEPYFGKPPQEAELKITLKNDATIHVLGADNADSLRGMYLDGVVMDEYAIFKPSVFSQVVRPALSDRHGWGVFVSTPRGKNLFYDVCEQARKNPNEWFGLTLKADTSGLIAADELRSLQVDLDPEEFGQEYLCSFDSALKGAIYASELNDTFLEGRVKSGLYDPALPTHVAFDLGYTDATVAVYWQVHRDGSIAVVACEVTQGQSIFAHLDKLNSFAGDLGDVWLPHDARAKNLQTGLSIVEQFIKEGLRPRIVPMHKVRDRIAATRRLFTRVYFDQEATGDLLEALKGYRREWDDNKLQFDDKPLHDWCSDYADAFGYMAMVCMQVTSQALEESTRAAANSEYNLANLFEDNELRRVEIRRIA